MQINKRALFITAAMLAIGATISIVRPFRSSDAQSEVVPAIANHVSGPGIEIFKSYKQWRRVTEMAIPLPSENAMLCIAPQKMVMMDIKSPKHNNKYYAVYVNQIGEKAMMRAKKPVFPVGSIIIKEKLPSRGSNSPELLTVKVKREHRYNQGNGDWEYLVLNGMVTKIDARGKLENCQSCHAGKKNTDYVFRDYLPPSLISLDLGE